MSCCGRPNNRTKKEGAASYYQKYAYLSGNQKQSADKLLGQISKCITCDALTYSDDQQACTVCGDQKKVEENT